jgi:hypothetical protein
MTLIRLVHRASILTSMAFASLLVYSNPAHADLSCIVADNGKAMCGIPISIPRMCISTGGKTTCGKFTTIKKEGENSNQSSEPRPETNKPFTGSGQRKEADKFVFLLKGCRRIDTNIKCELTISNKAVARGFQIQASGSTFVDYNGKTHRGSTSEVSGEGYAKVTPGIDYAATITFENIPEQITRVQLLDLGFNYSSVQFRNISFVN